MGAFNSNFSICPSTIEEDSAFITVTPFELKVGTILKSSCRPLSFEIISIAPTAFPSMVDFVVITLFPTPITFGGVV